jgi:transcriptional regulator with XRE-family HTH domain
MDMSGRPSTKPVTASGARLAALRKAAGLSQSQLAQALGIPQRTLCFYEREASYLPSLLLPDLARILGVSIEEVLGIDENGNRKRGPKSKLERQIEAISKLPRQQQQKILAVIEAFTAQHASD